MIELTLDECAALEKAVTEKICAALQKDSNVDRLYAVITQAAVRATIATIREYEKMKAAQ